MRGKGLWKVTHPVEESEIFPQSAWITPSELPTLPTTTTANFFSLRTRKTLKIIDLNLPLFYSGGRNMMGFESGNLFPESVVKVIGIHIEISAVKNIRC